MTTGLPVPGSELVGEVPELAEVPVPELVSVLDGELVVDELVVVDRDGGAVVELVPALAPQPDAASASAATRPAANGRAIWSGRVQRMLGSTPMIRDSL